MNRGVFSGAFSPFPHPGHLWAMQQAVEAGACDTVTVMLQTDPSIERPEKRKPELTTEERAAMLRACRYVRDIVPYTTEREQRAYYAANPPDVIILGDDWRDRNPFEAELGIPIFWAKRRPEWSGTKFVERIVSEYQLGKYAKGIPRHGRDITVGELRHLVGRDDPVIIEVGCNDGETTAKMLQVMPRATISCVEPEPRAIARNPFRDHSDSRVTLWKVAISNWYGPVEFYQSGGAVPHSNAPCRDDWDYSGSICQPTGHLDRDKLVQFPTKTRVMAFPLDVVVPPPTTDPSIEKPFVIDLIFADVQGAEALMILGGQQTLRRTRWLYCEFYNIEQYRRQPDLKGLLSFLPDFDLVAIYADNALLKNRNL